MHNVGAAVVWEILEKTFGLSRSWVANPFDKNFTVDDHEKMSCVIAMHVAM